LSVLSLYERFITTHLVHTHTHTQIYFINISLLLICRLIKYWYISLKCLLIYPRVKSSIVSVRVRSSYTSKDGDVLEIDKIEVHENFDKYVYLHDIALMKVRISIYWTNILRARILLVYCMRLCKVVTFIKLVAKESCRVWRKVASYCTAGKWKTSGWGPLCRDWLETNSGKYSSETRSFSLFWNFHNRLLENTISYRLMKYPGATTLGERVTPSFFRGETLLLELATSMEWDFYNERIGIFTGTWICKLSATSRQPVGTRTMLFKVTSVPKSKSLRNTVAKRSCAFVNPSSLLFPFCCDEIAITRNVS